MRLIDDTELHLSSVVANNAMNRARGLDGVNSYARDLGFHPLDRLRSRLAEHGAASWLDLCCGEGRALVQAAAQELDGLALTGVDLVGHFDPAAAHAPGLTLVTASLGEWQPTRTFDLITCVHGLHYVGDKLGALATALAWLAPDGFFAAHLDLSSVRLLDGTSAAQPLRRLLRAAGLVYDGRRRLLTCVGPRELDLPFAYAGADDQAGPNYTGQPAVDSYYRPLRGGTRPEPVAPPRRAVHVDDAGVHLTHGASTFDIEWDIVQYVALSRLVMDVADVDLIELTVDLVYGEFTTVQDDAEGFAEAVAEFARRRGRPAPNLAALAPGGDVEIWRHP